MDAARGEQAHVIGHSMGGLIALHLAVSRPRRVRTLVLLCTSADGADPTRPSLQMAVLGPRLGREIADHISGARYEEYADARVTPCRFSVPTG